jgi:hypothetical protein
MDGTTFTWKIAQLERETVDGYVYKMHYTVNAADGVYTAGAYGSINLDRPEENLIPYSDLTEQICLSWLEVKLGMDKINEIEAVLQDQLNEQHAPTRATGVPWSSSASS